MEREASFSLQKRRQGPQDEYPLAEVSLGLLMHVKTHVPMPEAALARLALREMRRMIGEAEARSLKINQPLRADPQPEPASTPVRRGAGRRPSAATMVLRDAMAKDAQDGQPRSRADYLAILQKAGGPASNNAAGIIVNREAKRAFGKPLGRAAKAKKGRQGGRKASPATAALREKLQADAAEGSLRAATHYVRWLVDKMGGKVGLKQARPVVYREMAAVRQSAASPKT